MKTTKQIADKVKMLRDIFVQDHMENASHVIVPVKYRAIIIEDYSNYGSNVISYSVGLNEYYIYGLTVIWAVDIKREFCVLY